MQNFATEIGKLSFREMAAFQMNVTDPGKGPFVVIVTPTNKIHLMTF